MNNYFGKDFLITGVILTVASLLLWGFAGQIPVDVIVWVCIPIIIILLFIAIVRGFLYLKKL